MSAEGSGSSNLSQDHGDPNNMKVLIIDDDRVSLWIISFMLEACGYKTTKCTSGAEGLEMLQQNKGMFDIVITDVHMPDIDGFQLLEKISLEMNLPVVMLSEDSSRETMVKGLMHGACDYLIKPVKMEELAKIGQHVLTWRNANSSMDADFIKDDPDDEE